MTDATVRIKNLSIALEALSRINNEGSPDLYDRISTALEKDLKEYKKEQHNREAIDTSSDDETDPF